MIGIWNAPSHNTYSAYLHLICFRLVFHLRGSYFPHVYNLFLWRVWRRLLWQQTAFQKTLNTKYQDLHLYFISTICIFFAFRSYHQYLHMSWYQKRLFYSILFYFIGFLPILHTSGWPAAQSDAWWKEFLKIILRSFPPNVQKIWSSGFICQGFFIHTFLPLTLIKILIPTQFPNSKYMTPTPTSIPIPSDAVILIWTPLPFPKNTFMKVRVLQ